MTLSLHLDDVRNFSSCGPELREKLLAAGLIRPRVEIPPGELRLTPLRLPVVVTLRLDNKGRASAARRIGRGVWDDQFFHDHEVTS
jgi:hypothetical protein